MTQTDGEIYHVLGLKEYCENDHTTQNNLHTIPFKLTMVFFTEPEQKYTICMFTQKTPNIQSNLEKKKMELEESTFLISDSTPKLQSLRQYGSGTKTEI